MQPSAKTSKPQVHRFDESDRPVSSRARYGLAASLFTATAINYLDRTNLSVALPHIQHDLGLGAAQMGIALSAFSWIYVALQVPSGWLVDKVGPKVSFGLAMIGWSLCTMATFVARSLGVLVGLRVALGVFEAPAFPANNRLVTNWFPARERGRATALYTAGEYVGLAVAVPILTLLITYFGWPSVFVLTGAVGLLFSVVWYRRVHNTPRESPRVSTQELAHIEDEASDAAEAGLSPEDAQRINAHESTSTWSDLRYLLTKKRLWGMYLAQFANGTVLFFFLTWFPDYLVNAKHLGVIKAGVYGSIPYLAALAGVLFAGQWSDWMMRRGLSRNLSRKLPPIAGFALATVIFTANFTNSPALVITIMSVAFFAQGLTQMTWAILADVAPRRLMGLAGGVFSFAANIAGAITPLIIGWVVQGTGSFSYGIGYIAVVAVIGLLSYLVLIDRIERLHA
jgi:ACS family D-galactonate transporter-like MFS transporter